MGFGLSEPFEKTFLKSEVDYAVVWQATRPAGLSCPHAISKREVAAVDLQGREG